MTSQTTQNMSYKSSIQFFIYYAVLDIQRRLCQFLLAFSSVILVVMATAVSQSVIDRAPLIFLKNAEANIGQFDVRITLKCLQYRPIDNSIERISVQQSNQRSFCRTIHMLDTDEVSNILQMPVAGQIIQSIYVTNPAQCDFTQFYFKQCNMIQLNTKFFDSQQEKYIGLGSSFPYQKLKLNQCVISKRTSEILGLTLGQEISYSFDSYDHLSTVYEQIYYQNMNYTLEDQQYFQKSVLNIKEKSEIRANCQIIGLLDQSYGKVGDSDLHNYIFFELDEYFNIIRKNIDTITVALSNGTEINLINELEFKRAQQFVDQIIINPQNRIQYYLNTDFMKIQNSISRFASNIALQLGLNTINIDLPLMKQLESTQYGSMFLGIILNMIIAVLFALSVVLLYSLLLISVESKTYELGVLRLLGFNKIGIVLLIISQALCYVIPAIIFGLIFSTNCLDIVNYFLEDSLSLKISRLPSSNAVLLSICLGFFIPMISSIIPIRSALQQQLSYSLDITRSKTQAFKIQVDVEDKKIAWGQIQFGLVCALFGLSIYYFLPIALISLNVSLLLTIFFLILLGMLSGLVILSFNIQYLFERLVVFIFFICAKSFTKILIIKNLAAHRIKNRRTALMYSLSLAFVVFIYTGMTVQLQSASLLELQKQGAYMVISAQNPRGINVEMRKQLEEVFTNVLKDDLVDFAQKTISLQEVVNNDISEILLTHMGKVFGNKPVIYGVTPNFFSVVEESFLSVTESSQLSGLSISEELYTVRGTQSIVIPEDYGTYLNANCDFNSSVIVQLDARNNSYSRYERLRVSSILKMAGGLKLTGPEQRAIVSIETFNRLTGNVYKFPIDIPIGKFYLKIKPGHEQQVQQVVIQQIKSVTTDLKIFDYQDFKSNIEKNEKLINIIFSVLTIVTMFLCFFSLSSSVTANIYEQSKEIGVLRAVGIHQNQIIRIYIYEAFVLLMSSSLIGILVGWIVGFTMSMQQTLFTKMPVFFLFPYKILIVVAVFSMICAVLSTLVPGKSVTKREIADIIRCQI